MRRSPNETKNKYLTYLPPRGSLLEVSAMKKEPWEDPNHQANDYEYHTWKLCIEGCGRRAGTAWSHLWCQPCNAERINLIDDLCRALGRKV